MCWCCLRALCFAGLPWGCQALCERRPGQSAEGHDGRTDDSVDPGPVQSGPAGHDITDEKGLMCYAFTVYIVCWQRMTN